MAGKPKQRLARLQQQLRAQGIDPATLPDPSPSPSPSSASSHGGDGGDVESLGHASNPTRARTRTRTREVAPPPPRAMPIGPATRNTIDTQTADDLDRLAAQLRPHLTARIERLRPTWASGWVEDYPLDSDGLGELLAYVRDEHGGQNYRITVIAGDGGALYTSRVPIAGMPRKHGREVPRSKWDGSEDEAPSRSIRDAATETRSREFGERTNGDLAELVRALGETMHGSGNGRDHVLDAVREMTDRTSKQTTELIRAIVETRSMERQSSGLVGQLREVVQATEAINEIREALAVEDRPSRGGDEHGTRSILDTAAAELIRAGIQNDANRRQQQPPQQQQRPPLRRVQVQRPPQRPPQQGNT